MIASLHGQIAPFVIGQGQIAPVVIGQGQIAPFVIGQGDYNFFNSDMEFF